MKHLDKDIDWTIFEFLEGNLSVEEALYVAQQIASHDTWKAVHSRWKASYLESEHIPYPNILELSQPKTRFKISRKIQWFAAASLLIAIYWFWGIHTYKIDTSDRLSKSNSSKKHIEPLHVTHDDYGFGSHTSSDTTRQVAATLNLTRSHLKSNPSRTNQMPGKLVSHASPNVARPDSFSKTIDVRPLPPKIKNPAIQNNAIYEILASFFPGEIRADVGLTWVMIDFDSRTELLNPPTPQRISAATISIDTNYFQPAETPIPKWQQIWQRTKKGQLPAVQLAVVTYPNSWIPSMNFNLRY
jgi:hypothetical protein